MAVVSSGQVSLNDLHVEAGGTSGTECSFNDSDIRGLIAKGSGAQMAMNEWYGAAAETVLTSVAQVNGEDQRQEILASDFISSGETLRIPSNIWVWSDSTSTAALTIDISCTIINEGKIIGRGGNGGGTGGAGGPAIKINSGVTGVTIENASGAYIAGGGGGGGCECGGGGGAGGGDGANGRDGFGGRGLGGSLNAVGGTAASYNYIAGYGNGGGGGGAGAGGGDSWASTQSAGWAGIWSGGGGGRKLGSGATGGSGGTTRFHTGNYGSGMAYKGGDGGANGNAGQNGPYRGANGYFLNGQIYSGSGGGGWGAAGGTNNGRAGGAGGKAVDDSGVTYTLTNNGTVYGGT